MREANNFLVQAGNAVSPAALAEELLRGLPPDVEARRVDDSLLIELKDLPPDVMVDLKAGRSGGKKQATPRSWRSTRKPQASARPTPLWKSTTSP